MRGLFTFAVTEQGCWLAILLFAFDRGGVGEVGRVAVLLLVPAAILAPLVAVVSDVFPRHVVLTVGYALIAATSIGTGLAMLDDAPIQLVYGLAVTFSILLTFGGPTLAAIIPTAASTADELTAANTATGLVDTAGRLVGPLLAGLILATSSPGAVLVWIGALMGLGAVEHRRARRAVVRISRPARRRSGPTVGARRTDRRAPAARPRPSGAHAHRCHRDDVVDRRRPRCRRGGDRNRRTPSGRRCGECAPHRVRRRRPRGICPRFALVGRRRLARALAGAVVAMCAAFAVLGRTDQLATATLLLVFVGGGVTLTSVAGRTMLQGLTPDDTLARLFGVLEALESVGLALGGLALSVLAVQTSVPTAFAVVGGAGIVGLAVMWPKLASIDRARRAVDPVLLRAARSSTVFSPLPPYAIEQVMNGMVPEHFDAGETLMTKGAVGDRMCLLADGDVAVDTETGTLTRQGPGVVVGEIALLRDVPRTATVTAGEGGVTVYWMDADSFLDAVNRVPRSRARAEAEASRRLER